LTQNIKEVRIDFSRQSTRVRGLGRDRFFIGSRADKDLSKFLAKEVGPRTAEISIAVKQVFERDDNENR